jgi:polysaccharide export outer membrane protein
MKTQSETRTSPGSLLRCPGVLTLLAALVCCLGVGCATVSHPASATAGSATPEAAAAPLTLQQGDTVKVTFESSTNLNTLAKIQLDGSINLPLVGDVKAQGKTTQALKTELSDMYGKLLRAEQVSVSLATGAACVYVTGAVLRPGRITMERPLTALDAVMEAGGFDHNKAKPSAVTVVRTVGGTQERYTVDLRRVLRQGTGNAFYLKPFDTVHVPERTFNF